ncbi:MAG TPA: SHOCT domain-containing protein, partial [Polyangiaceae bacterium]|nr:SHOCT domain-containing protein [Polyangiaceae bacterium]
LLSSQQVFQPTPPAAYGASGYGYNWWPHELGSPSSSGGQNDSRYAYFPQAQRLAIDRGGRVTVYNTLDHNIGGVQQQQGGASGSLSFSSQFGTFTVDSLPLADQPNPPNADPPPPHSQPQQWQTPASNPGQSFTQPQQTFSGSAPQSHDEILATIERLSGLLQKGILSEDEFRSKKAELLSRL